MEHEILLEKYRILKILGRGGTATVYLAEHIKLNSLRAIKFISKNNPLYFMHYNEAQILINLKHPCIPIIYDIEENEEGSYIIEEYIEGLTIKEYLLANNKINEKHTIFIIKQLCELILYLHSSHRPILYLDLKPENIIISSCDKVKLLDFGSALFQQEIGTDQKFYGTKGYAAPELYHNGTVDERSDIYSIGMLLYYMVSGTKFMLCKKEFQNSDYYRGYSKSLKRIIQRCLHYNPAQRYSTVTHLLKHLSVLERRSKIKFSEENQTIYYAVAGTQSRVGVTHFSFRLNQYFHNKKVTCLYQELNRSNCIWNIQNRYNHSMNHHNGYFFIEGITMSSIHKNNLLELSDYKVVIKDYGILTEDNLGDFLKADKKILILGAKDWELSYSEKVLEMVAEYKEFYYLFNYIDGRQFQKILMNMEYKNCYRIPYIPDPYSSKFIPVELELIKEITQEISER